MWSYPVRTVTIATIHLTTECQLELSNKHNASLATMCCLLVLATSVGNLCIDSPVWPTQTLKLTFPAILLFTMFEPDCASIHTYQSCTKVVTCEEICIKYRNVAEETRRRQKIVPWAGCPEVWGWVWPHQLSDRADSDFSSPPGGAEPNTSAGSESACQEHLGDIITWAVTSQLSCLFKFILNLLAPN